MHSPGRQLSGFSWPHSRATTSLSIWNFCNSSSSFHFPLQLVLMMWVHNICLWCGVYEQIYVKGLLTSGHHSGLASQFIPNFSNPSNMSSKWKLLMWQTGYLFTKPIVFSSSTNTLTTFPSLLCNQVWLCAGVLAKRTRRRLCILL